ncbi:MAG TPA: PGPGW domain-containing protein [Candidatus Saccharimonadales bacterium]|nr:PGPGW domain-containing protein [Candidatus Saccharimonadales bacterium]
MKNLLEQNWKKIPQSVRKIFVFVAGWLTVVAGVAMLALPGPGWAAIFLGFAILATEFTSARQVKELFIQKFQVILAWYKKHIKKR